MLRASLLTMALSSSCLALLGDWKVWIPTNEPRMAVVSGDVAWIATSAGVVEWDLAAGTSRVHTRLDGLPTMDYAAVVLDSQKTVWAIGADGRIGYKTKGTGSWQTVGSYATQNWTFSTRAALCWKGYLVFGTDHGISLFSAATRRAEDRASAFGALSGTVRSVMVTPGIPTDTLWVGLENGYAYTTPVWDSIGKPGHFLADPSKWVVRSIDSTSNSNNILVRSGATVKLANQWDEWSDATGVLRIQSGTVKWNGNAVFVSGALHATATGSSVVVSTYDRGFVLVQPSGATKSISPEGNFPDFAPVNARFSSDGRMHVLSNNTYSYRVLSLDPRSSDAWASDTIRLQTSNGVIDAVWHNFENLSRHRQSLAIDPQGRFVVPSWGDHTTQGGLFTSKPNGGWNHFTISATDTCMPYALDSIGWSTSKPKNYLTYGAALISARGFSSGTWLSALPGGKTDPARILYLEPGGQSAPTCLDIPRENVAADKISVNDFLAMGDTLWLASSAGLIRVPSPRPSYPPPLVPATYIKPSNQINPNLFRLAKISFEGRDWIVGAATGRLVLYPTFGGWGTPVRTDLITSDSSAPALNQSYYTLAIDAQGQIWAGGNDGIDIVRLEAPITDSLPPSFVPVRRITTADGLLDNEIYDFDLQASTGKALIATPHGLALWSSPYRPVATKLAKSAVRVYPNPVRLRDHNGLPADKVLIVDGATPESRFALLAADGTLVMHLEATAQEGGRFQVELPAPSKLRPGLYFWSLKDKKSSVRGPLLIAE